MLLGWYVVPEGWTAAAAGPAAAQGAPAGQAPTAQPPATAAPGNPVAVLTTSFGDITIELFKDKAPVSVENFLQYVKDGFFSGTAFHRVKPGFMIQGGGFAVLRRPGQEGYTLDEKPTRPPIQNEATNGLRNTRGTLGMARRAQLRSATSQFYINLVDNRMLDHTGFSPEDFGYAVFGRVLDGMPVVDRIGAVPTKTVGDMADVPVEPVMIKGVAIRD